MKKPVKLDDLASVIDLQFDGTTTFINTRTGDVLTLSEEEFRAVENERPIEDFPDWQKENIETVEEILEDVDGVYLDFTLRHEYLEYEIIEEFIGTVDDEEVRDALYEAIRGRGAFRRFKDKIYEYGVQKDWFQYKDRKIKELVIAWCKEHDIEIEE